jgi:hypothetical protein
MNHSTTHLGNSKVSSSSFEQLQSDSSRNRPKRCSMPRKGSVLACRAGCGVALSSIPTPRRENDDWSRAVATANRLGPPATGDDLIEHPRHSPAGEASVHFQRQTFPRVDIDHTHHTNRVPGGNHIMREIERLFLVGVGQRLPRRSDANTAFPLLPLQAQARVAVHPPQPLMVHSLALAFH